MLLRFREWQLVDLIPLFGQNLTVSEIHVGFSMLTLFDYEMP
jgi:hypothetical protein